ncbi:hypothetical protein AALP_AAs67434U000100 [Arabis alpina]|uniref:Jacalin-type lectin domain-containing protein n=1 Tax=Arabis alpina TaxID=50452 RepID=A0A087G2J5_ARAAL|nr:hypothetical protein AALP_AAs67434U000100 [Arabis alpina]
MALKVEAKGGIGGNEWDDEFEYEGVTKIHVRAGKQGIEYIKFEYVKAGQKIIGPIHGVSGLGMTETFEINHSDKEYLLSVEGYYDKSTGVIQSIQFKTNKETSDLMGFNMGTKFSISANRRRIIGFHGFADKNLNSLGAYFIRIPSTKSGMEGGQTTGKGYDHGGRTLAVGTVAGTNFVLQSEGNAIVGFHGRVGSCVDSIGAYYAPFSPSLPAPSPPEKLDAQGGQGGKSWDDGAYQNVKKIYIGQGENGIASVKFEYENDANEVVMGDEHGNKTLLDYEKFELDYPSEYITSVEGCKDKVLGAEAGVITMLKFKTNKRTSPPFGLESASSFVLQKEGHKITGFHGKSSTMLHQIGVHVVRITE